MANYQRRLPSSINLAEDDLISFYRDDGQEYDITGLNLASWILGQAELVFDFLTDVIDDTSPQLGGTLDSNGFAINAQALNLRDTNSVYDYDLEVTPGGFLYLRSSDNTGNGAFGFYVDAFEIGIYTYTDTPQSSPPAPGDRFNAYLTWYDRNDVQLAQVGFDGSSTFYFGNLVREGDTEFYFENSLEARTVWGRHLGTEERFEIRAGNEFRIYDSTNTDYGAFSHDGTDFNTAFTNTTDWNITGLNTLKAGNYTFDVDQAVGAGQDNFILTYDHSAGTIGLEAAPGGLGAEVNDLTAAVTWANIPDANVPQSAVTQHQAALSITESQISDLSTPEYASFYLSTGGLSGMGAGPFTMTVDSTQINSDGTVFSLATSEVTVNKTAVFKISAECSLNNSGTARTSYAIFLERNTGGGFATVAGTWSEIYLRGYDSGSCGSFTTILSVSSGDVFRIRAQRASGTATVNYQDDNGTRITFEEMV